MKNELTDVNLMFKAIIDSKSHEGGLLAVLLVHRQHLVLLS